MATKWRTTRPSVRRLACSKSSSASLLLLALIAIGGLISSGGLKASGYEAQPNPIDETQRNPIDETQRNPDATNNIPASLQSMVNAERAFAARAKVVGWKQSFLEYFSDTAVGFDGDSAGPAKDQIRQQPDPPKDLQLLWEPRYGDVAASGELGWLTGPSTTISPARNNGMPGYGNYASVWKRQGDGSYKVVIDVGIRTPSLAPFPPGFVRAPQTDRFTGRDELDTATRMRRLFNADAELTKASLASRANAYQGRLASGARLHYPGTLPLTGETAILGWLRTQPAFSAGETRFAEVAQSADLGYTWGSYAAPAAGANPAEKGFYVRVWSRGRDGAWKVALDVLQPQ